jgi:hypothetical protein
MILDRDKGFGICTATCCPWVRPSQIMWSSCGLKMASPAASYCEHGNEQPNLGCVTVSLAKQFLTFQRIIVPLQLQDLLITSCNIPEDYSF